MPKNGATPALHTRCDTYGYLPPTSTINTHTSRKIKKRETHVRATSSANARVLRTEAKSSDDQARAKRLHAAFGGPTIGLTAPPPRQIKSRDVVLEQLEQLCLRAASARCRLRHAMTSVRPAQGYSAPGSSAPARGKSRRASSGLFYRTPCSSRRWIPKPTPLSARGEER